MWNCNALGNLWVYSDFGDLGEVISIEVQDSSCRGFRGVPLSQIIPQRLGDRGFGSSYEITSGVFPSLEIPLFPPLAKGPFTKGDEKEFRGYRDLTRDTFMSIEQ